MNTVFGRRERFVEVASTNDVVRAWLAEGEPEVCMAVADGQTAGRGRAGRTWVAPAGTALLVSLGFRPSWLEPEQVWRLAAITSLAMADAAEAVAGLPDGTIRLKWPNDLVIETAVPSGNVATASASATEVRKLAGVLGETDGLGTPDPRLVIGIGLNGDWPADTFPPELATAMTSLRAAAGDLAIDHEALLEGFLDRLGARVGTLRAGRFDAAGWTARQLTTGRTVRIEHPAGAETAEAIGVDPRTGALLVADPDAPDGARSVLVGEIAHLRLVVPVGGRV